MKNETTIYILRCADGSLYTGITRNLPRRLRMHNGELAGGAKYTRSRRPVELVLQKTVATHAEATAEETRIKSMTREQKEQLIAASSPALHA